ncbi:hypothetical protein JCM11672_25070 [Alkaliphilus crotonatoxidans]
MKKMFVLLIVLLMVNSIPVYAQGAEMDSPKEIQAVWIATVFNLDFPNTKISPEAQKEEYIKKIDALKAMGINTVIVQIRPKADALYPSAINPWSDVLTGVQGQNPGYDPLQFMLEEAHKRGMEFHAWLNPYRVTTSGTDLNQLCENHPARLNPDWVITHQNALYYNPELKEVKEHIVATVEEIVTNYNVDAIHFDDYFYPTDYPLPAGEGINGPVANARRQHVNDMIQGVSEAIKKINQEVRFGISPMGIWKNNTVDLTGSKTAGKESYYSVYGDTRTWIKNQWIDYVVPQIYWEIGHPQADYETLVKWWSNEVAGTNVELYIGHGLYKDQVAAEIDQQLLINQRYSEVGGSFYYGMSNLLEGRSGCNDKIMMYNQLVSEQENPSATQNSTSKTGTVTASVLNIRAGGSTQHTILTKVLRGTKLTIIDELSGWYSVRLTNNMTGWVSADYILVD